jgi:15-cis-phytoene synthase
VRTRITDRAEAELDAAGISDLPLRAAYALCRAVNAQYGRTYYLATRLLPASKRPYAHALYAFARRADEIVDRIEPTPVADERAIALKLWGEAFVADLIGGTSADPICAAVIDTIRTWQISPTYFSSFLDSMAMDLTVREYPTYADLEGYMYGSAAVIGLEMLPILGARSSTANEPATALGYAFQLANFIRDVGEDLDRGRVYLPLEDLDRFGLTRDDLEARTVDDRIRGLLAFEIARVRRLSLAARPGIALLDRESQPCIDAARRLYCGIADEVEKIDYQVFDRRASVPLRRRADIAGRAWARAALNRRQLNH